MSRFRRSLLPFACSALLLSTVVGGDDAKKAAPAATSAEIDRLIKQLGSDQFSEREAASRQLQKIGPPAMDALRTAESSTADAEVRRRVGDVISIIEDSLEQLARDYRDLGLPLPPDRSPLVRYYAGTRPVPGGEKERPVHGIGFLIEKGEKGQPHRILRGWMECSMPSSAPPEVLEPKATPEEVDAVLKKEADDTSDTFLLAIQCESRGRSSWARAFLARARAASADPPRTRLREWAWVHWAGAIMTDPASDWKAAARAMRAALHGDKALQTDDNRRLLKSLEAALVPSKAKPGTVEALIDDLVNATSPNVPISTYDQVSDPRYLRLLAKGFEAVPALIEHADDDRLTRAFSGGGMRQYPVQWRVGDLVGLLLVGLSGEELGRDRNDGTLYCRVQKAAARDWFAKASKVGEESYLATNVLHAGPGGVSPNFSRLYVLEKKYPRQVAKLYRQHLREPGEAHFLLAGEAVFLAEAVSLSSLPRDEKVELFLLAAGHKDREHRLAGITQLRDLDEKQFVELLVKELDALPRTPSRPYPECPEASFAWLVTRTDDPRAWQALEKAAARADTGLRMQLLNPVHPYDRQGKRQREMVLKLLAKFLDDESLRDIAKDPKMFPRWHAGQGFPRLEVRNFAAMQAASVLEPKVEPKPDWGAEEWAKLRRHVREAIDRELSPMKKGQ